MRRVVRTEHVTRPDGEQPVAGDLRSDLLAGDLQLAVLVHRQLVVPARLEQRSVLGEAAVRQVPAVDADRRDERVVPRPVTESRQQGAHLGRDIRADVDGRVPCPALQRRQVTVAVAGEVLGLRERARVGLAAVEQRDAVAVLQRRRHDAASDER